MDALHYIAKWESIIPGPSKDSLAKYLRDSRKYSQLQTDLEQGSLLPGDSWTALAKYLNLPPPPEKKKQVQERQEEEEEEQKQVEQVWGQEKQEVQRLPDLPEKEKTSLEKTLPYLAAAGVLAGGEEEVVQRFREVVVPARTITNGLVLDLMQLSQVHILEE